MKPLLPRLIFLALAQDAFAQAGSAAGPAADVAAYCASLAVQIAELQGAKANIEQLNERATTSLGVNPCYTVYALARYIAHKMVDEINGRA